MWQMYLGRLVRIASIDSLVLKYYVTSIIGYIHVHDTAGLIIFGIVDIILLYLTALASMAHV